MIVKLGIDPTSISLHLGHAIALLKAKEFQDAGHKVVLIIGDFTAMIGDPSGQDKTRPILTKHEINDNANEIIKQITKVLSDDKDLLDIRFNSEWLHKISLEGLLELTSMVSVAQMIERRDFSDRLKAGKSISMTELIYPIMQGYDSVKVRADIEIGGTDQLFNLHMGRHLQKAFGMEKQQEIVTVPLLLGTDGQRKMSKSYGNSINLDDSAIDMFFKLMAISDSLALHYRELLIPDLKVDLDICNARKDKEDIAFTITKMFHGEHAAHFALVEFNAVVVNKEFKSDITEESGQWLSEVAIKYLKSKNEFRRYLRQGGIRVNGDTVTADFKLRSCQLEIGKKIKINIR